MLEDDVDDPGTSESPELWHIYFLTLVDSTGDDLGFVKVGITKGAVERRIAHLQTGNPYRIQRYASFPSPVARAVESWIHKTRQLEYLEWLRLRRTELDALVEAAKYESERLARIAQAMAQWRQVESNDRERAPSTDEIRLHDEMRGVSEDLFPTQLQLDIALCRIALVAGKVRHVPGIVAIQRREPFKRFKLKLALEKVAHLVAAHTEDKVRPHFRPKRLPGIGAPQWAALRTEAESFARGRKELNAAMLANSDAIEEEGTRTDELIELHERFLALLHKKTRLDVDIKDLKAQAIQATEDWEVVSGLWSHRRKLRPVFDERAFRDAHKIEAAASSVAGAPFILRNVFLSRSY